MRNSGAIWSLSAGQFVMGLDLFVVSPLLPTIANTFGVTAAQAGLLVTVFALTYGLLAPVFGPISDRLGRKRVLQGSMLAFAIITAITALSPSFLFLLIARAVAGIAGAAYTPSAYAAGGDLSDQADRTKVMAIVATGATVGMILGVPLGAWTADLTSWRGTFLLIAALAAVMFVVVTLMVPRYNNPPQPVGYLKAYKKAFAIKGSVLAVLTSGLAYGFGVGPYTFMGDMLQSRYGVTTSISGLVLGVFGFALLIGNVMLPKFVRAVGSTRRSVIYMVSLTWAAIAVVMFVPSLPLWAVIALLAVWAFCGGIGLPAQQTYITEIAGQSRGTLLSMASSAMFIGLMVATGIGSWALGHFSFAAIGILATIGLGLAIVSELFVPEPQKEASTAATVATHLVTEEAVSMSMQQTVSDWAPSAVALLCCNNPVTSSQSLSGQTVLFLGSSGVLDAFQLGQRVGANGRVICLTQDEDVLEVAQEARQQASVTNIDVLLGSYGRIPLADNSVDAVIGSDIVNLPIERETLYRELARVLKPGGTLALTDLVLVGPVDQEVLNRLLVWGNCHSKAITSDDYEQMMKSAGFSSADLEVSRTLRTGDLMLNPAGEDILNAFSPEKLASCSQIGVVVVNGRR